MKLTSDLRTSLDIWTSADCGGVRGVTLTLIPLIRGQTSSLCPTCIPHIQAEILRSGTATVACRDTVRGPMRPRASLHFVLVLLNSSHVNFLFSLLTHSPTSPRSPSIRFW